MPRPAAWTLTRTPSQLSVESRALLYDPSANLSQIGGATYIYDTRGRLTRDSLPLRAYNPVNRLYDGFGNLTSVTNEDSLTVNRANNRITGPGTMRWNGAGQLLYDGPRQLQRDYYPDGLVMTEYQHTGGYMVQTSGISGWLYDARGERAMSFWGTEGDGNSQLYLHTPRDESGRVLTEYRAEPSPPCVPDVLCTRYDRYQKDYVWVGRSALLTWTRGTGARFSALNHLGSPEYVFDDSGSQVGRIKLDSFGQDLGTTAGVDRHRFTGHERDHATGLDGPSLPLADHMHARTYVPKLARFTRPDPAASFSLFDPQTLNRYIYAGNTPLKYVDPDGREVRLARDAAAALAALRMSVPAADRGAVQSVTVRGRTTLDSNSLAAQVRTSTSKNLLRLAALAGAKETLVVDASSTTVRTSKPNLNSEIQQLGGLAPGSPLKGLALSAGESETGTAVVHVSPSLDPQEAGGVAAEELVHAWLDMRGREAGHFITDPTTGEQTPVSEVNEEVKKAIDESGR